MTELIPREWLDSHPKNILQLERPEVYTCVVERYQAGHPTLLLKVYGGDRNLTRDYLEATFSGVMFFAGPMEWCGANLCVAQHEEWRQLMQQLGWLQGVPEAGIRGLAEELRMFVIEAESPTYQIRFVAANLHVSRH